VRPVALKEGDLVDFVALSREAIQVGKKRLAIDVYI